jgi:hypothetical protein
MQVYTVEPDELTWCRKLIEHHAEDFGNIGVGLGPEDSNPSWFGSLPAATKLAGLSRDLHVAARTQFFAAQEFSPQGSRKSSATRTCARLKRSSQTSICFEVLGPRCARG